MALPTTTAALHLVRTQPAVPLSTAAVALGIGTSTASRHVQAGTFPVPTIRMGARVIVPTPALRKLLQLPEPSLTTDTPTPTPASSATTAREVVSA